MRVDIVVDRNADGGGEPEALKNYGVKPGHVARPED